MKIDRWNTPGTGETADNAEGGILIVMPPAWGPEKHGEVPPKARGLITSAQIDRGPVIPELLRWLEHSGIDIREHARMFSILVWPSERFADCRGPQTVARLIEEKEFFLTECRRRTPQLIIFLSCYFFDAACDATVAADLRTVFGEEIEKPRRICSTRLRAELVRYEKTLILGLPLPGRNTASVFVDALTEGLSQIFKGLRYR